MKLLTLWPALLGAVGALTGCTAVTRPVTDLALGAGGAALGAQLAPHNPLAIAGGAAGGVLLGEGLHYANRKGQDQSYQRGYQQGRSDAVKQQYWLYVSLQQPRSESRVHLYPVHLPEQVIDGVLFEPTTQLLRVEETGNPAPSW